MSTLYSRFESVMQVRPDDIDMNRHVHSSRYMDYVLAARYDQMARCYKVSMEEFLANGFGWVMTRASFEYKRPLLMGEWFVVRTWIAEVMKKGVSVGVEIEKKETGKAVFSGHFEYNIIDIKTGRATEIPQWILEKYTI